LWTGQEILRARSVTLMEAELLEVPENTAVMDMERISYAANGVAVEYVEAVWRGDRYDFKVTLSRPRG
jgi:GntR family transcriptional regulator